MQTKLALLLAAACVVSCKTTERSELASSQPPTSGERKGKQGSSRVFLASTPNVKQTLNYRVWMHLSELFATRPDLVGCKNVSGAMPTRECTTYDPATRADFLYCFAQSDNPGTTFDPAKLDNINCSYTAAAWPVVSSYLADKILPTLLDGAAAGQTTVELGGAKKLKCAKADAAWKCQYEGFGNSVEDFVAKRLVLRPADFGDLVPPAGAVDELGKPLPKGSKTSQVTLKGGAVVAKTFKADQPTQDAMLAYLPDTDEAAFKDHMENVGYTSPCKPAEVFALMDYSMDGYKDVNAAMRKLNADANAAIDPTVDTRVRSTISGVNCARKANAGVVVRGATLSPEKLARYKPGAFVVEPSFTSTTIGEEVHSSFEGNTEFQIFDAKGADLTNLSMLNEEGEGELLFQAGSLFKVLAREQDGELTIIKMAYIP